MKELSDEEIAINMEDAARLNVAAMAVQVLVGGARCVRLSCRICAELGTQFVNYASEGFDTVVTPCPVPVVMAGGKKNDELEALKMVERAIQEGAAGVDMGRNIFQSAKPAAMTEAVANIVHAGWTAEQAFACFLYNTSTECRKQLEAFRP